MLLRISWNIFVYVFAALFTVAVFVLWFLCALIVPSAWDALLDTELADFGFIFYEIVDTLLLEAR